MDRATDECGRLVELFHSKEQRDYDTGTRFNGRLGVWAVELHIRVHIHKLRLPGGESRGIVRPIRGTANLLTKDHAQPFFRFEMDGKDDFLPLPVCRTGGVDESWYSVMKNNVNEQKAS